MARLAGTTVHLYLPLYIVPVTPKRPKHCHIALRIDRLRSSNQYEPILPYFLIQGRQVNFVNERLDNMYQNNPHTIGQLNCFLSYKEPKCVCLLCRFDKTWAGIVPSDHKAQGPQFDPRPCRDLNNCATCFTPKPTQLSILPG